MGTQLDSGIYRFVNLMTGQSYIGQSVNLLARQRVHLSELRGGYHYNEHFQRAFTKYGEEAFSYDILERCDPQFLDEREQYWIDLGTPQRLYNIHVVDVSSCRGVKQSPESIAKRVVHLKGRQFSALHRARLSLASKGRKLSAEVREKMRHKVYSEETRRKMSASAKRRRGRQMSPATRAKISAAHRGMKRRPHTLEESLAKSLRQTGTHHRPRSAQALENIRLAVRLRDERKRANAALAMTG